MENPRDTSPLTADAWVRRMRSWGVRPSKSKGQNFLLDHEVVARIADAAGISPGDRIVEIGPGLGVLTEELLRRGANLTAIELDDSLAPHLKRHFHDEPAFRLIHGDATSVTPIDVVASDVPFRIVANLPYSVATRIIRHWLESEHPPIELVVMVQQEVADRMTAAAGDMSLLGLAIQLHTHAEYLFAVPSEAFHPPPKVTSAVVRLRTTNNQSMDRQATERLFQLATIAFRHKRKTIANSLSRDLEIDKATLVDRLNDAGIDGTLRPQALDLDTWIRLSRIELDLT